MENNNQNQNQKEELTKKLAAQQAALGVDLDEQEINGLWGMLETQEEDDLHQKENK
ncbi:DUF4021 domain-containing protein [Niallia taxi]|uniref:DUF4021 domain-containing protein n=1 Tax=Niallia taxi TaxID=2499688 RepID=UPI001CD9B9E4|nr:DUF4021 domain-containing protein [Niallia taxi]MCM3214464.1 DUF4021 domain-containing protein [Niallia taxi]MED4055035.1 DUF4021 domain-containing protein [Niallia taxi]MED4119849.1 DUF4021 domain-containing protein [Niallia taxi]